MISCKKIDLNDEDQCNVVVDLLNIYAKDLMGGGDELSVDIKTNLPIELRKRSNICHVFIAYNINIPIGLAICFEGFSTFSCKPLMNIHDFCVIPDYRRYILMLFINFSPLLI